MKNALKSIIGLFVLLALASSCTKETINPPTAFDEVAVFESLKLMNLHDHLQDRGFTDSEKDIGGGIKIKLKFGRRQHDGSCGRGFGICAAEIEVGFLLNFSGIGVNGTLLEVDPINESHYSDVLLAEAPSPEIPATALTLTIDEDIELPAKETGLTTDLSFKQGTYEYDASLGEFGGYRFQLD